jgi:hypothetical protein
MYDSYYYDSYYMELKTAIEEWYKLTYHCLKVNFHTFVPASPRTVYYRISLRDRQGRSIRQEGRATFQDHRLQLDVVHMAD